MERKIRFERNIAIGIAAIMIVTNGILTLKLYTVDSTILLLPTLDRELKVGRSYIDPQYLKLRAEQVIYLLFTMRRGNTSIITKEILKQVDGENEEEFKKQIEVLGKDIEDRGYRYWFTDIQDFEIDHKNLTVKIGGYLETYLADKQIDRKFKCYLLSFRNRAGLMTLAAFEEVKKNEE